MLMQNIGIAVLTLCALSGSLAALLLVAEHFLANYGECAIDINGGEKNITVIGGQNLLSSLSENKIFLPSACGGRGSCSLCKCRVLEGAGPVLPTELPYLSEEELKNNTRLSCQVKVKKDLRIAVPSEFLSVKQFDATVESITDCTHDIKAIRLKLPEGESMSFRAGQYIQLYCEPYGDVKESVFRAYSLASAPSDKGAIELIIRLVPNGIVTTYVFEHMREGGPARVTGPFGDFYLRESGREIVFIAGGSGLAPIRGILYDMIDKGIGHRKAKFFFGAVTLKDLYFVEEMKKIAAEHEWFEYVPALSGEPSDDHGYETGLITDVVDRHYKECQNLEAYLCGSPGMIDACVRVLTGNGMPEERIFYDKFS